MVRSLIIIALAIVCGAAAAIGVNQTLRRQARPAAAAEIEMQTVFVASARIARGERLSKDMIHEVQWPIIPGEEEARTNLIASADDAVGRVALSAIMQGEPLYDAKLTKASGEGFIASIIEPGMRAKTIETRGPSASVAGFVRPQDRVDVLLNIRGSSDDETGGSSTTTLLQNVEILAIDQVLDPNVSTLQMVEMWTKGDEPTSVTLQVDPAQALLLDLGQAYGELSLALRGFGDDTDVTTQPATVADIAALDRFLRKSKQLAANDDPSDGESLTQNQSLDEAPPRTYIQTYRGSVPSRVDLVR